MDSVDLVVQVDSVDDSVVPSLPDYFKLEAVQSAVYWLLGHVIIYTPALPLLALISAYGEMESAFVSIIYLLVFQQ